MAALGEFIEVNEFGISLLCPTPRDWIEFVWEDTDGNRDGDAFGIEIAKFAPNLPIETGARERRVRQPGDGDVVEDIVARKALGPSVENARESS